MTKHYGNVYYRLTMCFLVHSYRSSVHSILASFQSLKNSSTGHVHLRNLLKPYDFGLLLDYNYITTCTMSSTYPTKCCGQRQDCRRNTIFIHTGIILKKKQFLLSTHKTNMFLKTNLKLTMIFIKQCKNNHILDIQLLQILSWST